MSETAKQLCVAFSKMHRRREQHGFKHKGKRPRHNKADNLTEIRGLESNSLERLIESISTLTSKVAQLEDGLKNGTSLPNTKKS